jgi:hypothetical protein
MFTGTVLGPHISPSARNAIPTILAVLGPVTTIYHGIRVEFSQNPTTANFDILALDPVLFVLASVVPVPHVPTPFESIKYQSPEIVNLVIAG